MASKTQTKLKRSLALSRLTTALDRMSERLGVAPVDVAGFVFRRDLDFEQARRFELLAEWAEALADATDEVSQVQQVEQGVTASDISDVVEGDTWSEKPAWHGLGDLSTMTKAELEVFAGEIGLSLDGLRTKRDYIQAIEQWATT